MKFKIEKYFRIFLNEEFEKLSIECPICKFKAFKTESGKKGDCFFIVCPRCGEYEISETLNAELKSKEPDLMLSSYLRRLYEFRKDDEPIGPLTTYNIDSLKKDAERSKPEYSEKIYLLLKAIEHIQEYTGEDIIVWNSSGSESNFDKAKFELFRAYFLAMTYSSRGKELEYLFHSLRELGYLQYSNVMLNLQEGFPNYINITPYGYKYLEEIRNKERFETNKVFIAMAFKPENDNIYKTIKQVLNKLGYDAVRVDKEHYTGYIIDFILAEIKESRFVVAEITDKNLNVFFEFSYALGHKIPVIPLLKKEKDEKDPFEKIPFDIKQFNTIVYENEEQLKEKLRDRIRNLFGRYKV
ncbi:MAG TPA: hypothetical protein ENG63_10405 [Candidatus Desulfofervidus auxilii]|uniref:Toll/interleukin-1 receptor domain-containing protein n=1 Tax=Desulfofervidus auxilii TaxID=1621989 RepID=A0A7C0Y8N8_DESA2|nr:hypothetical protein [Candidatus Desulfofervidus auxilii]